jgi:hypothetical protein
MCKNMLICLSLSEHCFAGEETVQMLFETKENSWAAEEKGEQHCSTCLGDGSQQCQKAVLGLLGEIVCMFFHVPSHMS